MFFYTFWHRSECPVDALATKFLRRSSGGSLFTSVYCWSGISYFLTAADCVVNSSDCKRVYELGPRRRNVVEDVIGGFFNRTRGTDVEPTRIRVNVDMGWVSE